MQNTYLVTGATSALGLAVLDRLLPALAPGDRVLALGYGDLNRLAGLCRTYPGMLFPYDLDLSRPQTVDAFLEDLSHSHPAPTHLLHLAAAPVVPGEFAQMDEEDFFYSRAVQQDSLLQLCRAVLPQMARAGFGRVLLCAGGRSPQRPAAALNGGALGGMTRALASLYPNQGVTVNCVFSDSVPPRQAAPVLLFLLGEEAGCINGLTLPLELPGEPA